MKVALGQLFSRIVRSQSRPACSNQSTLYSLHRYTKPDGTFDYEQYRAIQTEGNRRKINLVWAVEENIQFLSGYIKELVGEPKFGICHGTRRGKEQEWFSKYLKCQCIGTEISDTASMFPNTIQWDFHETKPEWIGSCDFIYSNSFDHSYKPGECLRTWMSCLRPGGVCVLEHTFLHGPAGSDELDPFGAELHAMPYLIVTWAEGKFYLREILKAPHKNGSGLDVSFLVIQRPA